MFSTEEESTIFGERIESTVFAKRIASPWRRLSRYYARNKDSNYGLHSVQKHRPLAASFGASLVDTFVEFDCFREPFRLNDVTNENTPRCVPLFKHLRFND